MIEYCRNSVGCPKENSALQHLEIKIMMDVCQIVLANTSPNYSVFWVKLCKAFVTKTSFKKDTGKNYAKIRN